LTGLAPRAAVLVAVRSAPLRSQARRGAREPEPAIALRAVRPVDDLRVTIRSKAVLIAANGARTSGGLEPDGRDTRPSWGANDTRSLQRVSAKIESSQC
jgi:hypothetical protein